MSSGQPLTVGSIVFSPQTHCLYCNEPTDGTMYCSEAHRKRYKRMPEDLRLYPRPVSPGMQENRCNVHGEVYLEYWLKEPFLQWTQVDGCKQCQRDAVVAKQVELAMRDPEWVKEKGRRVDAEYAAREGDLAGMIEDEIKRQIEQMRPRIEFDMRNVLRGAIGSKVRDEMEQELKLAFLKGELEVKAL